MSDGVDQFEACRTSNEVLAFAARVVGMAALTKLLDALLEGKIIDCDSLSNAGGSVGVVDAPGAARDGTDQAAEQMAPGLADIAKDAGQCDMGALLGKLYREGRLDLAALDPADHDLLGDLYRLRGKPAREYLRERRLEHLLDGRCG